LSKSCFLLRPKCGGIAVFAFLSTAAYFIVEILLPFPPGGSVVKILLPAAVLNKAQKARTCAVFVQGNRLRERNFSSERPADEYFMFILVPKPFVPGAFPIAAVCPKCRNCRDDICPFACCRFK
jgi:hypothetical protein